MVAWMGSANDRTDAEIVEEVVLNLEAALECARAAEDAGQPLGHDTVELLTDIHARLLRDGLRGKPDGVLF